MMRFGNITWISASRSALFVFAGIHGFVYWFVVQPTTQATYAQGQWLNVLWFSALLLILGIAIFVFGLMVGGRGVIRWATVAAAAVTLGSLVNIVEDGFRVEEAFLFFIVSTLTFDIALLAMTIFIGLTAPNLHRLLAVVPAGTLAATLFFITAGGPILLVTWFTAAAAATTIPLPRTETAT